MAAKNGIGRRAVEMEQAPTFDPGEPRFPVPEVARQLKTCTKTAYELIAARQIGHLRVGGRVFCTQSDIDAYLRSRYIPRRA